MTKTGGDAFVETIALTFHFQVSYDGSEVFHAN